MENMNLSKSRDDSSSSSLSVLSQTPPPYAARPTISHDTLGRIAESESNQSEVFGTEGEVSNAESVLGREVDISLSSEGQSENESESESDPGYESKLKRKDKSMAVPMIFQRLKMLPARAKGNNDRLVPFEVEYDRVAAIAKQGNTEKSMEMIEALRRRPDFTMFHNIMCFILVLNVSPIQDSTLVPVIGECWKLVKQFRDHYPPNQSIPELDDIEEMLTKIWDEYQKNEEYIEAAQSTMARDNKANSSSADSWRRQKWKQFDEDMKTINDAKDAAGGPVEFLPTAKHRAVSLRFETGHASDHLDHWTDAVQRDVFRYRIPDKEEEVKK